MIYLLEDNIYMAEALMTTIKRFAPGREVCHFTDAVAAMQSLDDEHLPCLIFLDVLLTGPDGFTLLNELASYQDTAKIPVVIISSLDFSGQDLAAYGVVGALNKETLLPGDIEKYVTEYA